MMITQIYAPSLADPVPFIFKRKVHQVLLIAVSIIFAVGMILYMLNPLWSPIKLGLLGVGSAGIAFAITLVTIKSILYPESEKVSVFVKLPKAESPYSKEILEIFGSEEEIKAYPEYNEKWGPLPPSKKLTSHMLSKMNSPIIKGQFPNGLIYIAIKYIKKDQVGILFLEQQRDWLQKGEHDWSVRDKSNLLNFETGHNFEHSEIKNFMKDLVQNKEASEIVRRDRGYQRLSTCYANNESCKVTLYR